MRAVARHAGVNERTVYRHFANERELRDAVLTRLRDEAGVDLDGLRLEDLKEVAVRILEFVSTFPIEARSSTDPTVAAENARQRDSLLEALGPATAQWQPAERRVAAGIFDLLWSPVSYERLVSDWGLPPEEAIRGVTWVMTLVEEAVRAGVRP